MLAPAEFELNHRGKCQCGVGATASQNNIGAGLKRLRHRKGSDICIGTLNTIANAQQRRTGIDIAKCFSLCDQAIDLVHYIVAQDNGNL